VLFDAEAEEEDGLLLLLADVLVLLGREVVAAEEEATTEDVAAAAEAAEGDGECDVSVRWSLCGVFMPPGKIIGLSADVIPPPIPPPIPVLFKFKLRVLEKGDKLLLLLLVALEWLKRER
jgi:hypothetical protein